jgi:hypothetical protein
MERRVAELHLIQARERALRLFTLASTIFPEEWAKPLDELAVVDLTEFAIHARRITELCDLRGETFSGADASRFKFSVPPPEPLETNYNEALNQLIHAKTYTVGHMVWDGPKIFLSSAQNLTLGYVRIATDRKATKCVSIFGVSTCFLTAVLPAVKTKHPQFQF